MISVPYAYKLIRELNKELRETGCITIAGRLDRKFFHEKFYGAEQQQICNLSKGQEFLPAPLQCQIAFRNIQALKVRYSNVNTGYLDGIRCFSLWGMFGGYQEKAQLVLDFSDRLKGAVIDCSFQAIRRIWFFF